MLAEPLKPDNDFSHRDVQDFGAKSSCLPHADLLTYQVFPSVTFPIIRRSKKNKYRASRWVWRGTLESTTSATSDTQAQKNSPRCVYFTRFAPSSGDKSWGWDECGELFNQVSAWQRASPRCLRTFFFFVLALLHPGFPVFDSMMWTQRCGPECTQNILCVYCPSVRSSLWSLKQSEACGLVSVFAHKRFRCGFDWIESAHNRGAGGCCFLTLTLIYLWYFIQNMVNK